eukprot:TRINITY_DN7224_c0_g1_i1.p1 TRINITY_DN7224_c0_g1~~TRINITY_DN7224_c0_g1_i1.p1  ORF type:complete len:368 (+),score=100.19 TRINITY_DN7224_c0_g1_i1:210-1313(+)
MAGKIEAYGRGLLKDFTETNLEALIKMPKFMKKLFNATIDGENFFYSCVKDETRTQTLISVLSDNITRQKAVAESLGEEVVQFRDSKGVGAMLMMLHDRCGMMLLYSLLMRSKEFGKMVVTNEFLAEMVPGAPNSYEEKLSRSFYRVNFFVQVSRELKGVDLLKHFFMADPDLKVPLKCLLTYYPFRPDCDARTTLHILSHHIDLLKLVTRDPVTKMLITVQALRYKVKSPPKSMNPGGPRFETYLETTVLFTLTRTDEGCKYLLEDLLPFTANKLLDAEAGIQPSDIIDHCPFKLKSTDPQNPEATTVFSNLATHENGKKLLEFLYTSIPDMKQRMAARLKENGSEAIMADLQNYEEGRELLKMIE